MEVSPLAATGRQMIEGYRPGHFLVSGAEYSGSIIVLPERTLTWDKATATDLALEDLTPVLEVEPPIDVLLIGCGARMAMLPRSLREELRQAGIGADIMDTGAACRTYNVLVSEDRRVAAALIAL